MCLRRIVHTQIYHNAAIASTPSARLKHRFDGADVDKSGTLEAEELVAVIEELQEHDKSLNDGKDPHLLKTERYWGPSYFTDEVPAAVGASSWWSTPAKTVKRNFFVAEAEKTARYALPFVWNISHFIK